MPAYYPAKELVKCPCCGKPLKATVEVSARFTKTDSVKKTHKVTLEPATGRDQLAALPDKRRRSK